MVTSRSLLRGLREELKPIEERIAQHPYVAALETGAVRRERLKLLALEQHHIVRSDIRSIALMVSRFPTSPAREFFLDLLQGDVAGFKALRGFSRTLGLRERALEEYQPLPGAHAYTAYLAWLALYASDAALAASFLVNLHAWGSNCARVAKALKARYGLKGKSVAFFDLFGTPAPDLERRAAQVVQHGLSEGADPVEIRRCAKLLQSYELMFWDALHQASA